MRSVATFRLVDGSIFETVPSPVLGTQTAPAPITGVPGRAPTATVASAGPVDEVALLHAATVAATAAQRMRCIEIAVRSPGMPAGRRDFRATTWPSPL